MKYLSSSSDSIKSKGSYLYPTTNRIEPHRFTDIAEEDALKRDVDMTEISDDNNSYLTVMKCRYINVLLN